MLKQGVLVLAYGSFEPLVSVSMGQSDCRNRNWLPRNIIAAKDPNRHSLGRDIRPRQCHLGMPHPPL